MAVRPRAVPPQPTLEDSLLAAVGRWAVLHGGDGAGAPGGRQVLFAPSPPRVREAGGYAVGGVPMSKQPRNLNAVFGRLRRRMLAAELSTDAAEPARRTMPATPPDPPPRLPARALGEYVPGGRVDAMRRLLRGR